MLVLRSVLGRAAVLAVIGAGGAAHAVDAARSPLPSDQPAPLAGPRVAVLREPGARPTSLVETGINGRLRRLEEPPEIAALALLDLTPAERERADRVIGARARALELLIADNLLLLNELDVAGKAGDQRGALLAGLVVAQKLRPLIEAGDPRDALAAALEPATRERYLALLAEYDRAIIADRLMDRKPDGTLPSRFEVIVAQRGESFGREAEAAFRRAEASGDIAARYVLQDVTLTPAQERRVRELLGIYQERVAMGATQKQQEEVFVGLLATLTPAQAEKVMTRLRGPAPEGLRLIPLREDGDAGRANERERK
jgi:hypothetical protein